jgi:hypothetical protein
MRRWCAAAIIITALTLPQGVAAAQDAGMEITLDQSHVTTSVGRMLTLESRIVNHGSEPSKPMLAHVNVAGADGGYVDLEDWSAEVTQRVEALQPGQDTTLTWDLQAVNAGSFHVYVVLLPNSGPLVPSGAARVDVGQKRNLNAGGVLPVAIAVPLILGIGAAAIRYRVRRRTA